MLLTCRNEISFRLKITLTASNADLQGNAVTIWKTCPNIHTYGQTLLHVDVLLPETVFTHGQIYVALSRAPGAIKSHSLPIKIIYYDVLWKTKCGCSKTENKWKANKPVLLSSLSFLFSVQCSISQALGCIRVCIEWIESMYFDRWMPMRVIWYDSVFP